MNLKFINFNEIRLNRIKKIEVDQNYYKEKECKLTVTSNNIWHVKLILPSDFPYRHPSIKLVDSDRKYIGRLEHVNAQGVVCVTHEEGLLIDYHKEREIIIYYLEKAIEVLEKALLSLKARNFDELYDEIEGYWQGSLRKGTSAKAYCFLEPDDSLQKVNFYVKRIKGHSVVCGIGSPPGNETNYTLGGKIRNLQAVSGLYVPLSDCHLLPPEGGQTIEWSYLLNMLQYITETNVRALEEFLQSPRYAHNKELYLLLSQPRPSGGKSLLGFRVENITQKKNPLLDKNANTKIELFLIQRHYPSYLRKRAGSNPNLSDKKLAILGCGSIGSEVIYQLVKSGVSNLLLVDEDDFEGDNLFRHRLGADHLTTPKSSMKVHCIKQNLNENIPYLNIELEASHALNENSLKSCDLVVSCIGHPVKNLKLNCVLKKLGIPSIYAWLESTVGGHVVYIHPDYKGCLECQFLKKGRISSFKYALLAPEQEIIRNLTGCAGGFIPFSYNDACQTASLATRIIGLHLSNKLSANHVYTWMSDKPEEFEVTENYVETSGIGYSSAILANNEACRICNE